MTAVVRTMKFRDRDYRAEEAASTLPRTPSDTHPLATFSSSSSQVDVPEGEKIDFYDDPLRGPSLGLVSITNESYTTGPSNEVSFSAKEWANFKRSLMQKFSFTQTISISPMSDVIVKGRKGTEKSLSNLHLEELDDPQKNAEEEVKLITRQEYISRLHELKDDIGRAWRAEDRVTSLKLSIKVARLLMDTSVAQFYPAIFILVTEVLDMLGNLVWERIKRKAEYDDDGNLICSLRENFKSKDVCYDAKETCNNWFCKIGSIRELLPRMITPDGWGNV